MASAEPDSPTHGFPRVYDRIHGWQCMMPGCAVSSVMMCRKAAVLTRLDDHSCVFTSLGYVLDPDIEYEVIYAGGGCARAAVAEHAIVVGRHEARLRD